MRGDGVTERTGKKDGVSIPGSQDLSFLQQKIYIFCIKLVGERSSKWVTSEPPVTFAVHDGS